MSLNSSPIAAIATAPGRGGIGVVRISGKQLGTIIQAVCGVDEAQLMPRHATYLPFKNAEGGIIDQGLAIYFKAPHSYTGEDVLELQGHGGPVVMQMLLARCLEAGQEIDLRMAEPGEFTQRAFLNDKLDLAAEVYVHTPHMQIACPHLAVGAVQVRRVSVLPRAGRSERRRAIT